MDGCNPKDCPLTTRVEALEKENHRHTETHTEIFRRLGDVEKSDAVQKEQYKTLLEKLDEHNQKHDKLNAKLEALESKPGKRWDGLVDKAIWAVVAAVIAFLLGRFGL